MIYQLENYQLKHYQVDFTRKLPARFHQLVICHNLNLILKFASLQIGHTVFKM